MTKMRLKLLSVLLILSSSCGVNYSNQEKANAESSDKMSAQETEVVHPLICPRPDFSPEKISVDREDPANFLDENRDVKDIGTEFVIQQFFNSKDTLFNFMKLVYQSIDSALAEYRKERSLEERAIFFLFKGGNVLRMVANEVFDQLGPDARTYLRKEYEPYFKRSDADFSVYIDDQKLEGYDYNVIFREVTELVFAQLNKIRSEFASNPQKYFNFFRLNLDAGRAELGKSFLNLNRMPSLSDVNNATWYNARFSQLQLRDYQAEPGLRCFYQGQFDYRYEVIDNKVVATRLSTSPHWIYNTDNRALQWTWGSDPRKVVKFTLLRSKVAFENTFVKDGKVRRKPIGGELIDVSVPHHDDARLRDFLDRYDETVKDYKLISEETGEELSMKAYSYANLVEDLQFIILDSFNRPWQGGHKYLKRVNRLFFLFNVELLTSYGLSNVAREYLEALKEKFITPLSGLYPLNENSEQIIKQIKFNSTLMVGGWKKMALVNHFFTSFSDFVERIVKNPVEGDQDGFQHLLDSMEENINKSIELMKRKYIRINQDDVYNVETKNLF